MYRGGGRPRGSGPECEVGVGPGAGSFAALGRALGVLALAALAACSSMGPFGPIPSARAADPPDPARRATGEVLGTGPVRVALLLPLSGDPALSSVGTSMANAARIAMQYIADNTALPDNITIVLKDTGADRRRRRAPPRARRVPKARASSSGRSAPTR